MHEIELLAPVAILLVSGIIAATLGRRLGLPAIVGYFIAGVLIGPYGFVLVPEGPTVSFLAELGVVFLLFDIGLHFSLKGLWETRRQLFGLGPLQVGLSVVALGGGAYLAGLAVETVLLVAATLALSSTAVVLQSLSEADRSGSPLGRTATAVLIFQDLFAIVLLVLVGSLGGEGHSIAWTLGAVLLRAGLAVGLVAAGGRLVRPLFSWVTRHGNDEAFTATALLIVLATAGLAALAGLSMPLGAFLAGMLLSESEYCYRVKTDIKPFRGLLLGLFFITVGMSLKIDLIGESLGWVLLVVVGIVVLKALAALLAARIVGMSGGFAVHLGFTLAQGSEFAFAVFGLAVAEGVVSNELGSILIAAVALSMALTPLMAGLGRSLGEWIEQRRASREGQIAGEAEEAAARHRVLLNGISPSVRTVARGLFRMGLDYVALETDPLRLAEARADGFSVAFGSAEDFAMVEAAGADRTQALVLGRADPTTALPLVKELQRRHPGLKVLVQVSTDDQAAPLRRAGAIVCVSPEDPDDKTLAAETLRFLGIDESRIQAWINEFVDDPKWEKADKAHAF